MIPVDLSTSSQSFDITQAGKYRKASGMTDT